MTSRIAIILACLAGLGLAAFLFFYARPLYFLLRTKREFGNAAGIWLVPKPLAKPSNTNSLSSVREVSYFGYEFYVPNTEVKEERKTDDVAALNFAGCAGVVILKPQPGFTDFVRQGQPETRRAIESVYGKEATNSAYLLRSAVLNATPRDLSFFASPHQMVRNSVLLALKGSESERFQHGLYTFETPTMRGFLEGDIALDKGVLVETFDPHDQLLKLVVARKTGKTCFGQPELNVIIFSLRPVPGTQ